MIVGSEYEIVIRAPVVSVVLAELTRRRQRLPLKIASAVKAIEGTIRVSDRVLSEAKMRACQLSQWMLRRSINTSAIHGQSTFSNSNSCPIPRRTGSVILAIASDFKPHLCSYVGQRILKSTPSIIFAPHLTQCLEGFLNLTWPPKSRN